MSQVQVSLLEQTEASKEDESMIPKSPQLTTHDMVSCAPLDFSPSSYIIVLPDFVIRTSEEALDED